LCIENVLVSGFDSSTLRRAIYGGFMEKNEVAPFLVKIEKRRASGPKKEVLLLADKAHRGGNVW
jgi:hypothetical protein